MMRKNDTAFAVSFLSVFSNRQDSRQRQLARHDIGWFCITSLTASENTFVPAAFAAAAVGGCDYDEIFFIQSCHKGRRWAGRFRRIAEIVSFVKNLLYFSGNVI